MATAPQLDAVLATVDGDGDVVVDLAGVTFMDSSGIGVLVQASQRARAAGQTLRTRRERDNVWRTLEVTNLAELLHPDRD
jgi:stage II sporulation protein AA (anti-sigma F factor antagonist)